MTDGWASMSIPATGDLIRYLQADADELERASSSITAEMDRVGAESPGPGQLRRVSAEMRAWIPELQRRLTLAKRIAAGEYDGEVTNTVSINENAVCDLSVPEVRERAHEMADAIGAGRFDAATVDELARLAVDPYFANTLAHALGSDGMLGALRNPELSCSDDSYARLFDGIAETLTTASLDQGSEELIDDWTRLVQDESFLDPLGALSRQLLFAQLARKGSSLPQRVDRLLDSQYLQARQSYFGETPEGAQRKRLNIGAGPDHGIVVTRFFINGDSAAFGMLKGDGRDFNDEPDAPHRIALAWDPATGDVSYTISGSKQTADFHNLRPWSPLLLMDGLVSGTLQQEVPALPIEDGGANDIHVHREGNELVAELSGLNSVTHAFEVNFDLRINPSVHAVTRSTATTTHMSKSTDTGVHRHRKRGQKTPPTELLAVERQRPHGANVDCVGSTGRVTRHIQHRPW